MSSFDTLLDDYLSQGHEFDKECKCHQCWTWFRIGDRYESKAFPDAKEKPFCSPKCFILWYEEQDNDISEYQDMLGEV